MTKKLEKELNNTLGLRYWQLFYAIFFWSNIATPLNLAITILSAITTARATESGGSEPAPVSSVKGIAIALVVLTTLNTFLRPSTQVGDYMQMFAAWRKYGAEFEELFYSGKAPEVLEVEYRKLLSEVNKFDAPSVLQPLTEIFASLLVRRHQHNNYQWLQITNPRFVEPDTTINLCSFRRLLCWGNKAQAAAGGGAADAKDSTGMKRGDAAGRNSDIGPVVTKIQVDASAAAVPVPTAMPPKPNSPSGASGPSTASAEVEPSAAGSDAV